MLLTIGDAGFALPQLLGELARYLVDGGVEIVLGVLRVNVRPGDGEVYFDDMLPGARLVVEQNNMGGENAVGKLLQMGYLVRHVCVNGCRKGQMSGAKMDLHAKKVMKLRQPAREE